MANPKSFRLTEDNLAKLTALAKRREVSLNRMINIIISVHTPSDENHVESKAPDSLVKGLVNEINSQKQRTNVLQNQIDFLIKQSKNAKSRN